MKDQKIQRPPLITMLFLSWFFSGKSPKAPGTVGSLATLPLIYLLFYLKINIYSLIILIAILYIIAVMVTQRVQVKYHLHDPQWIVIDEVIGMLVTWSFVPTIDFPNLFLVFGLFRLFDIIKFWPASYFDRLHHGLGTITDDVISGLYAGIICHFLTKLF
ncbi:MAG: phosphatidylglycerophosphatase A [Bacteriovoracaceae bacterium]